MILDSSFIEAKYFRLVSLSQIIGYSENDADEPGNPLLHHEQ